MRIQTMAGLRQNEVGSPLPEERPLSEGPRLGTREYGTYAVEDAPGVTKQKLKLICARLKQVRRKTDPDIIPPIQSKRSRTLCCRRNAVRAKAVIDALDLLAPLQGAIPEKAWFAVFVLIDRLPPKLQLRCLRDYLCREIPQKDVEWQLELMKRWVTRTGTSGNEELRTRAISYLSHLWMTTPDSRYSTAQLIAYLLCRDNGVWPLGGKSDWEAVLRLLPKSTPCKTTGKPACMNNMELLLAAGLLEAARELDRASSNRQLTTALYAHLGEDIKRVEPYLGSLNAFAVDVRRAEVNTKAFAKYQAKCIAYLNTAPTRSRAHKNSTLLGPAGQIYRDKLISKGLAALGVALGESLWNVTLDRIFAHLNSHAPMALN